MIKMLLIGNFDKCIIENRKIFYLDRFLKKKIQTRESQFIFSQQTS